MLVAVSLIPLALANGYEEHGYSGGGGDHYDKGHEAHVSALGNFVPLNNLNVVSIYFLLLKSSILYITKLKRKNCYSAFHNFKFI